MTLRVWHLFAISIVLWAVLLCGVAFAGGLVHARTHVAQWSMGFYTPYVPVAPVASIQWEGYTHMIHVGVQANADGSLTDIRVNTASLVSTAHANGLQVCLNLAGIDANFNTAVTSHLALLVTNTMAVVASGGYDCLDIDWETDWDATKAAGLFSAFRTALGTRVLTSDALINYYTDYSSLHQYLDRVNVLTYDMAGTFDPNTWFNAPVGGPTPITVNYIGLSVTRYNTTSGVPLSKINIGLPFFGIKSTGGASPGPQTGPRQSYGATPPTMVEISYADIVATYASQIAGQTFDSEAQQPWFAITGPSGWINYDNAQAIIAACQYAVSNSLGGWITWEPNKDYIVSLDPPHPLLQAIQAGCRY